MITKSSFWIKAAAIAQLLTAAFHSISLFISPQPENDTEKQLYDLMANYKPDAGAGFHPSVSNLFTALSSCFTLLCLYGGVMIFYLLKKISKGAIKGLLNINLLVFGACFAMMAIFTFLPPVILTGLIVLCLIIARLLIAKETVTDR